MPSLARIGRLMGRRRRLTALAGVIAVLGVAALNTHAALHERDGALAGCACALSIAVLGAVGLGIAQRIAGRPRTRIVRASPRAALTAAIRAPVQVRDRAGPSASVVLRL